MKYWILSIFLMMNIGLSSAQSTAEKGTCEKLKGTFWRSYSTFQMGLGPNGIIMGNRGISFSEDNNEIHYGISDYGASGNYTCTDREGKFEFVQNEVKYVGFYQPNADVILFQGIWFKRSID